MFYNVNIQYTCQHSSLNDKARKVIEVRRYFVKTNRAWLLTNFITKMTCHLNIAWRTNFESMCCKIHRGFEYIDTNSKDTNWILWPFEWNIQANTFCRKHLCIFHRIVNKFSYSEILLMKRQIVRSIILHWNDELCADIYRIW